MSSVLQIQRPLDDLCDRLSAPGARVGVVGLGYVGLPLAVALTESGARVQGFDVSQRRVNELRGGRSAVEDVEDARLAGLVVEAEHLERGLSVSGDADCLLGLDAAVICVPTPLDEAGGPDLRHVVAAGRAVAATARPGQLIVLESTTWPGTTERVLAPLFAEQGLIAGEDICLAFSPERIDPGHRDHSLGDVPKVVGGLTPRCTAAASALYGRFCRELVPVSSPATAEMVKLLENTFRSVNIALINELADHVRGLGLDPWEVVAAAATKPYGFMPFQPGPGPGGHCIPVDPLYLQWRLQEEGRSSAFIELADRQHRERPRQVVELLRSSLGDLSSKRVLLVGLAYKAGVADVRESPALRILDLLEAEGVEVEHHDPRVPSLWHRDRERRGVGLEAELLARLDASLIVTNQPELDVEALVDGSRLVIDTRNATAELRRRRPELAGRIRLL